MSGLWTLKVKKISSKLVIFGTSIHHIHTYTTFYNKWSYKKVFLHLWWVIEKDASRTVKTWRNVNLKKHLYYTYNAYMAHHTFTEYIQVPSVHPWSVITRDIKTWLKQKEGKLQIYCNESCIQKKLGQHTSFSHYW